MTTFKALRVHADGKSTTARFDQITLDDLHTRDADDTVTIRIAYSCLNYKDALAVTGKGRIMRRLPCVAGIDLSGVVESSRSAAYKPGDKVLVTGCEIGETLDGGLAEFTRLPAGVLIPLPPGLSLFEAMALGTAGFTAGLALRRLLENNLRPELGPVAVTGATGGVGGIALGLLKRAGFRTAAITGKAQDTDYLHQLGADEIIDRNTLALGSKPLEPAIWGGAIDNLGGDMLAYLTRTTRLWGSIAAIGLAQSASLNTSVMPFILRGVSLLGIYSVDLPWAWRVDVWNKLASDWKLPHLDTLIATRVIELDEVPRICEELVAGMAHGRSVVRIADL